MPAAHATAGAWTLTNAARTNLLNGTYGNLTASNGATIKLLTSSSNIGASSTTCAGVTGEVANGNGYTTGGVTGTLVASGTTTVTLSLSANVTFQASGGSIVFRYYLICYNSQVLAYALGDNTPADITITNGNTETLSNSQPVWTVA
ncbi:hypothetical protein H7I01_06695 [Mycobacterium palustre]|uniref:Uncharacterized protein n=1 Tax=Mycobacterium palustre TaxID=153971 RepID=A0A1X1ZCC1_9MYCO|nr:hypothetical protein [Mycobacterium palustre]ORW21024.1 hypothetical protein AWC19_14175 [Mycobacterium palustre]